MKKLYSQIMLIILTFLIFPFSVFAYSNRIIPGGENLGIEINSKGVMVVGFYKINNKLNKGTPALKVGDVITYVGENKISSIDELVENMDVNIKNNQVKLKFIRDDKEKETILTLKKIDGVYKTGLYVKDSLTGIGTLTYIDPTTNIYGALGHEIVESNTNKLIEIKTGIIFKSSITSIQKSEYGSPGGKKAKFFYDTKYGNILKNTKYGIYGTYDESLPNKDWIEVSRPDEIKLGKANIYTVLKDEEVGKYEINITKINNDNKIKNIYFEIVDKELLEKTGGIVQGMSGSPIIQNNKIIGAVTHVIVDNPTSGYGIFITTMLEEGEN